MEQQDLTQAPESRNRSGKRARTVGRRPVVKAGLATAGGLALGTTYVRPGVVSVGVQETYAVSAPPLPPPPPPPPPTQLQGCTPGYWGNSPGGRGLWDRQNDPDWKANALSKGSTNPFTHSTPFNTFFTPVHPGLNGVNMLDLVGSGGGSDPARQAARDLVAAYLNASFGLNCQFTTGTLVSMWNAAVSSGKFADFHATVDAANNAACPLKGRW